MHQVCWSGGIALKIKVDVIQICYKNYFFLSYAENMSRRCIQKNEYCGRAKCHAKSVACWAVKRNISPPRAFDTAVVCLLSLSAKTSFRLTAAGEGCVGRGELFVTSSAVTIWGHRSHCGLCNYVSRPWDRIRPDSLGFYLHKETQNGLFCLISGLSWNEQSKYIGLHSCRGRCLHAHKSWL
jgi:hypothetical protein